MKKISFFVSKTVIMSFVALMSSSLILEANAQTTTGTGSASASASAAAAAASSNLDLNTTQGTFVAPDANRNALVGTMCNVLRIITGNAGKAFAAFAIISVGIGFFTGKVSWGLMIGVAAGIAAMFGAPTIVAAITGRQAFDCSN